MNILFLCRFLPHPQVRDSGGQDVYHYIASLHKRHAISLIAFVQPGQEDDLDSMRSICEQVVAVPYYPAALRSRLWRQGWRLLLPRVYGRCVSLRYLRSLRNLLSARRFDVVIVDGMMAQYGKLVKGTKRILDEIDVYSVVAYHIYRNENRLLPRIWDALDWLRSQVLELHYIGLYDAVLVRSQKDKLTLNSFIPDKEIAVLPPWFEGLGDLQNIALDRPDGNKILFVGAMNLPANIEAVLYFARKVLPLIRQQVPDVEFYIVGNAPSPRVEHLAKEDEIRVTGGVRDLSPYYEQCVVNVVPLLRGGGIIVKTLNGLAAGRPTVATSVGNSGTGAQPGRDLSVADCPGAFANAVTNLLLNRQLWQEMARNGRRYVINNYHWEDVVHGLDDLLQMVTLDNNSKEVLKLSDQVI